MLVAFNAANYARHLEKKSAKQVKDEFLAVLRSLYDDVPEPRSVSGARHGRAASLPPLGVADARLPYEVGPRRNARPCLSWHPGRRHSMHGAHRACHPRLPRTQTQTPTLRRSTR